MRTIPVSTRESIWEYPRIPIVEPVNRHIEVIHNNSCISDTRRALRVCENGHAPSFYLPPEDVRMELLEPSGFKTFCEWKGVASYFDLVVGSEYVPDAAWVYREPSRGFEAIRDFISFYPARVDACLLDGEIASPEPRSFYGGWITSDLEGPFR